MNLIFPLAFFSNSMAMTGLLIILVMIGEPSLAADVGIVQAITLALFHSFSANARSLIFSNPSFTAAYSIMSLRGILLLPLSGIAYWVSLNTANIDSMVALTLIFRRAMEWLSEVHACEIERKHQTASAWFYFSAQIVTLVAVLMLHLIGQPPWVGFLIWGVAPAVLGSRLAIKSFRNTSPDWKSVISSMLPHFGSSAINGLAVYVFRLLVLASVGKILGGELFAAFAVGGIVGSVFANVLGPSVAMHEQRTGTQCAKKQIGYFLNFYLLTGVAIAGSVALGWVPHGDGGRSNIFWLAVGLSMIGGVLMVRAQRIKIGLIQQHNSENNLFGPDVVMNILIVAAVPFLAHFVGGKLLASLYLLTSVLALLFYVSAKHGERRDSPVSRWSHHAFKGGVVVSLLMPVFFQWSQWIFQSNQLAFDSGGVLANLPLPISIIGCAVGIIVLGKYSRAYLSLTIIFFTFVLMVLTSLTTFQGDQRLSEAKFILLIQFVLPMYAFVLGQMYESGAKSQSCELRLERTLFSTALLIMVCHLLASWFQGSFILIPNIYFFGIYQYLEYVPIVLISAVLIGYFGDASFMENIKLGALTAVVVGLYIGASVFPIMLFLFVATFFFVSWFCGELGSRALIFFSLGAIFAGGYIYWGMNSEIGKESNWQGYQHLFPNIEVALYRARSAWEYHFYGATSDLRIMLLGHLERPPRSEYPSAYNYYLGVVYNFGLVAMLPLVFGIFYTLVLALRARKKLLSRLGMLAFSATLAYLLLVQNSLSVAMQQPYPAIFIFFIWGVYLSRLMAEASAIQESLVR